MRQLLFRLKTETNDYKIYTNGTTEGFPDQDQNGFVLNNHQSILNKFEAQLWKRLEAAFWSPKNNFTSEPDGLTHGFPENKEIKCCANGKHSGEK